RLAGMVARTVAAFAVDLRRGLVVAREVRSDRLDEALLPLGLAADRPRLRDGLAARQQLLRGRRRPERMVLGHRDAPPRHRAAGVLRRDLGVPAAGLFIEKRVEQRRRDVELL